MTRDEMLDELYSLDYDIKEGEDYIIGMCNPMKIRMRERDIKRWKKRRTELKKQLNN